jgi:hypothetical protein
MPDNIKVRVGQTDAIKVIASVGGGAVSADKATNVIGGIASVTSLHVSGITTLGVTTASQLQVTGITTLGVTTLTDVTAQQLFISGISTLGITTASQLQVSGITTLGVTTASQLYVSGVTTTTTLKVGTAVTISNGIVTATSFSTGAVGTAINIGISTITGPSNLIIDPAVIDDNRGSVTIKGDLYVLGKETSISSQTIELADHRVGIATTVGTDQLLDGGGIGIGSANILKTFTYDVNVDALKSSVGLAVTSEGSFIVGLTTVLNKSTLGSGVTNSSLTSVGNLTQLNVIGVTTLGITTISQLQVGGATTFTGISTFSNNVNIDGTLTAGLIDGGSY